MTRALTGEIVSIDGRGCRGWARLPNAPNYPVMVHLVEGGKLYSSTIADLTCDDPDDARFGDKGWFVFTLPDDVLDRRNNIGVIIGESGELLKAPSQMSGQTSHDIASLQSLSRVLPPVSPVFTYRDALAWGLSAPDIINLFYLDILRRPADSTGLSHNMAALNSGRASLDQIRKALFDSEEYQPKRLKITDLPGQRFSHPIVIRSSSRRQSFEKYAEAFQRSNAPIAERLLRYFPGMLTRPSRLERLEGMADRGIPTREVFCRALSELSDRPALILPDVPEAPPPHDWITPREGGREVSIPLDSALFAPGWHKLEDTGATAYRWMSQIGVIKNPCPSRSVERVDIVVVGWYGGVHQALALASSRHRLSYSRHDNDDGSCLLSVLVGETDPNLEYLVLVASEATCPYRLDGSPDPRVLSLAATNATFVFDEEAE